MLYLVGPSNIYFRTYFFYIVEQCDRREFIDREAVDSSILPGSQVAMMTGTEDPGEKYFYNRDVFTWKFSTQWLTAKRQQDDCGGLWRIHDDLYDLSGWEKHHPGNLTPWSGLAWG